MGGRRKRRKPMRQSRGTALSRYIFLYNAQVGTAVHGWKRLRCRTFSSISRLSGIGRWDRSGGRACSAFLRSLLLLGEPVSVARSLSSVKRGLPTDTARRILLCDVVETEHERRVRERRESRRERRVSGRKASDGCCRGKQQPPVQGVAHPQGCPAPFILSSSPLCQRLQQHPTFSDTWSEDTLTAHCPCIF